MSVTLAIAARNPALDTLGSLELEVSLTNTGASALSLPGRRDRTDALSFEVRDLLGATLRRINGLTHHEMMVGGRPEAKRAYDTLGPGDTWRWSVDLASYHYPFPAGDLVLVGVYDEPGLEIRVESPPCHLTVLDAPVTAVSAVRDNSLLDMLTLVIGSQTATPHWYLRQHNHDRPLAAWYSQPVAEPGASSVSCASHAFVRFDTFDHCYDRWVVWACAGEIRAQRYRSGRAIGEPRAAPLPEGVALVPASAELDDGSLRVFVYGGGELWCAALHADRLEPLFAHPSAVEPVVRVAPAGVHVMTLDGGLRYERLAHDGSLVDQREVIRTPLWPVYAEFDGCRKLVRAMFRDGEGGRHVQMVVFDPATGEVDERVDEPRLRGELHELHFDRDDAGRFHLLASTSDGSLSYLRDQERPARIAKGQRDFHPMVVARRGAFLGCHLKGQGFNFLRYSHRPNGTGLVSFESD